MKKVLFTSLLVSVVLTSCVSKKQFTDLQAENDQTKSELVTAKANLAKFKLENERAISNSKSLQSQVDYLKNHNTQMLDRLQDLSILSNKESDNVKNTLNKINEQDKYIKGIRGAMARKDSMNMALVLNLKGALADVNDSDIQIKVEKGVVFISISDKLLFNSGSYRVSNKAVNVLGKVAKVLKAKPDIDVMVEGHTDNKTIKTAVLQDNWDLSVKRATSVVRILQHKFGITPVRLTAAGRSSYVPIAPNDTKADRAKNRRTRIIILPKLDQFFDLLKKQ